MIMVVKEDTSGLKWAKSTMGSCVMSLKHECVHLISNLKVCQATSIFILQVCA